MTDAVDFELHAAIRGTSMRDYSCPDEDPGCPLTRHVLCAFGKENATTKAQQLQFMVCWDKTSGTSEDRAKKCAEETKMDVKRIADCVKGGDGDGIMSTAASAFSKKFPGAVGVPRVNINGKDTKSVEYDHLLSLLCKTGIDVPACKASYDSVLSSVHQDLVEPKLSMLPPAASGVITV
mmetsp:Transcript_49519/g.115855  ORF Transcript_49519/g.115855 Transcript_49519/m.115855 type:complete len:179 (-) Transcript_49519:33-569(-)